MEIRYSLKKACNDHSKPFNSVCGLFFFSALANSNVVLGVVCFVLEVEEKRRIDAEGGDQIARKLEGHINRKVICVNISKGNFC